MKKGRADGWQPSKDEMLINNGMGGIDNKGCVSAGWKEDKTELRSSGTKATLTDLLALAPKNDPFGVFTEARVSAAEWAA